VQRACKKRRLSEWTECKIDDIALAKSSQFLTIFHKVQQEKSVAAKKQVYTLQSDGFFNPTPTEMILILKEFFAGGQEGWPTVEYFCSRFKEKCDPTDERKLEIIDFAEKLASVLIQSQQYLKGEVDTDVADQSASIRYKSTQCVSNFCSVLKDLMSENKEEWFCFLSHCSPAYVFSSLLSGCITLLQARSDGNSLKDKKCTVITSKEECYSEQNLDEHVELLPEYRLIMRQLLRVQLDSGPSVLNEFDVKFDHVLGMLADLFILQQQYKQAVTVLLIEAKTCGALSFLISKNPLVRKLVRCFRRLEQWSIALVCCQFLHDKTSANGFLRECWAQAFEIAQQMPVADLTWLPFLANADLLNMLSDVIFSGDKRVQKDRLKQHLKSGVLMFQPKDLGKKFLDNLYHTYVVKPGRQNSGL